MITLVTPTGGRPYQFHLCQKYIARQTYKGTVTWIVVDDCIPETSKITEVLPDNWNVIHVYPEPKWQPGQNSQSRNLAEGMKVVKGIPDVEAIFIIEDDDYYKPDYIEKMLPRLKGYEAAGELYTIYYNVYFKKWVVNGNDKWSSLFQTVFTTSALKTFERCYGEKFIDYCFFRMIKNKNLFKGENYSIGIKGQPGRYGIGAGHQNAMNMIPDYDYVKLRELLGDDAQYYDGSYSYNSQL